MDTVKIVLRLNVAGNDKVAEFMEYVSRETAYRVQAEFYKRGLASPKFQELNEFTIEEY